MITRKSLSKSHLINADRHSESIEQLALNEVYLTVHFVSPGAHHAAPSNVPIVRGRLRTYCSTLYTGQIGAE